MKVKIKSFAGFRNILGKEKDLDLAEEEAKVEDLLKTICRDHPTLDSLLFKEGEIRADVNIFVSGKNIDNLQSLQTPLAEGDEVALFPASIGG